MIKTKIMFVLVSAVSLVLSGCATIISGTDQPVSFASDPSGAEVVVNGVVKGVTPFSLSMERLSGATVQFKKEGYETLSVDMKTAVNGWFLGNIILGGLLGSTTDGVSGAIHRYSPDNYFVTLEPEGDQGFSGNKSKSSLVKQIFVAFGPELRAEIKRGEGTHLDELLTVLDVSRKNEEMALAVFQRLEKLESDDVDLAVKILELYPVE